MLLSNTNKVIIQVSDKQDSGAPCQLGLQCHPIDKQFHWKMCFSNKMPETEEKRCHCLRKMLIFSRPMRSKWLRKSSEQASTNTGNQYVNVDSIMSKQLLELSMSDNTSFMWHMSVKCYHKGYIQDLTCIC